MTTPILLGFSEKEDVVQPREKRKRTIAGAPGAAEITLESYL